MTDINLLPWREVQHQRHTQGWVWGGCLMGVGLLITWGASYRVLSVDLRLERQDQDHIIEATQHLQVELKQLHAKEEEYQTLLKKWHQTQEWDHHLTLILDTVSQSIVMLPPTLHFEKLSFEKDLFHIHACAHQKEEIPLYLQKIKADHRWASMNVERMEMSAGASPHLHRFSVVIPHLEISHS